MFDCKEKINDDDLKELKEIIKTDAFREVNNIILICDLNQEEEKIIQNIKDYIWSNVSFYNRYKFSFCIKTFISFMKKYQDNKTSSITIPVEDGEIPSFVPDLLCVSNGYHIYNDYRYLKSHRARGLYMRATFLGCDHNIYLAKRSMKTRSLPVSDEIRDEVDYNSLLAERVFAYFNEPVANYFLMVDNTRPFNLVLTRNFLQSNQELIHLDDFFVADDYKDSYANRLALLEENLSLRYKDKMDSQNFRLLIDKLKLQFCKQTFLKQLIGPMDINFGNTAIILTHKDDSNIPEINISPAFDLDISFNIAEEMVRNDSLSEVKDSNGQASTITSLIMEFKDIPGFIDFIKEIVDKISTYDIAEELLDDVYKRTKLTFFKERKDSYISSLNRRFIEVLKAYRKIFLTEDVDEIILGRQ